MGSHCLNAYADSSDKHGFCRGSDCTGTFCESLKNHVFEAINYKRKEMLPISVEENESHTKARLWYIRKEKFQYKKRNI